jgi:uncharacterized protein YkwD
MFRLFKLFFGFLFLAGLSLMGWWFFNNIYPDLDLPEILDLERLSRENIFQHQPVTSQPLAIEITPGDSFSDLEIEKIFYLGNQERLGEGLSLLVRSDKLDQVAQRKVRDMFDRQYFAHDSPDGHGVNYLANQVGYEFILVGENLAMGNFTDEAELIQGWMNSPGHRENIMHQRYQEIGLAAERQEYQGLETWMIVQVFGLPLSNCLKPDESLKDAIEVNKLLLNEMYLELQEIKEATKEAWPRRREEHQQLVDLYNLKVDQYNSLVNETENQVTTYNKQIQDFNFCIDN